jgi:hypothetical protein
LSSGLLRVKVIFLSLAALGFVSLNTSSVSYFLPQVNTFLRTGTTICSGSK